MPTKTIELHVSANNNVNGLLHVRVNPWRVRLDANDTIVWKREQNGNNAANDIVWFRVEQIDRVNPWPFGAPEPPDPIYTATAANGFTVTTGPKPASPALTTVSYGLTIGFKDGNDNVRVMYIDPDMVVDS